MTILNIKDQEKLLRQITYDVKIGSANSKNMANVVLEITIKPIKNG